MLSRREPRTGLPHRFVLAMTISSSWPVLTARDPERAPYPPSIRGMKNTSAPGGTGWKYPVSWYSPLIATVVSSSRCSPRPGIQVVHRLQHAAQILRLHLELPHAAGVAACEARGEDDPRQRSQADRAASRRGGDIGSSVIRLPVAISIALAMAAIGGQMLTSPTPFAPYGCVGFGTSTRIASIIGRSDATGQR